MAAIAPIIGLVGSLIGPLMSMGNKPPKAPDPIPPPPPPAPPKPPEETKPEETLAAEADRLRMVKRRQQSSTSLTGLYDRPTQTSQKTLLGE